MTENNSIKKSDRLLWDLDEELKKFVVEDWEWSSQKDYDGLTDMDLIDDNDKILPPLKMDHSNPS